MSHDTSWNIEIYKDNYESKEHWELRKAFMIRWKEKFTEDELVCLARVFMNIEFLGCKYSKQVMEQVALLSKDVAADFRKNRQSKLKRTFVSASDAAQDRAKGIKRCASDKIDKDDASATKKQFVSASQPEDKHPQVRSQFGNLVIMSKEEEENPIQTITASCQACHIPFESKSVGSKEHQLWINKILVTSGKAATKSESKSTCFTEALKILKDVCYTIVLKKIPEEENASRIIPADDSKPISEPSDSFNSTLASRMMKMMGWKGGSLGANESGISEPIMVDSQQGNRRLGLGAQNDEKISQRVKNIITDFQRSNCIDYDLVFASDFSKMQRVRLHSLAKRIGLKSRSYGKDENRYLTVATSVFPPDLVKILICRNFSTRKYELKLPLTRKK